MYPSITPKIRQKASIYSRWGLLIFVFAYSSTKTKKDVLRASAKAGVFFISEFYQVLLMMQDTTKVYTVDQVSKILGVRKGFVYDLIYTGRIWAIRLSERRFRITQTQLDDFFRQEEEAHAQNICVYSSAVSTEGLIR